VDGGANIPEPASRAHRSHLDSSYARPIALGWDADRDLLTAARAIVHRAGGSARPAIPMVVLGEILLTSLSDMMEGQVRADLVDSLAHNLGSYLRSGRVTLCGWGAGASADAIEVAKDLRDGDPRLEPTDALVVATAIECSSCDVLFTSDRGILLSRSVLRHASLAGLAIREAPRG